MGLVKLLFEFKNSLIPVAVKRGITLLEAAAQNPTVPLRGACEGSLACTTCHVVLDKSVFKKCGAASEREEDLLDTSKLLTSTSRLGCQVKVIPEMENSIIRIPNINKNIL